MADETAVPKQYEVKLLYRTEEPMIETIKTWTEPVVPDSVVPGTFLRLVATNGAVMCVAWDSIKTVRWEQV